MPTLTLYGPETAPFTMKARGALAVKKLEYEHREPEGPEDYKRWSPTGLLPVLEVDGTRIPDSAAILDYLDERFPEPPLVSDDPKVANSQRRLEAWVEASFMFYWTNYLRELVDGGSPRTRRRGRNLGVEYSERLDDLVNFLGGRPFFYGDRVSRADLAVHAFLRAVPEEAGADQVRSRPALVELLDRVDQEIGSPTR